VRVPAVVLVRIISGYVSDRYEGTLESFVISEL
jgi:hypothetical protein